ncbi:MAG: apolipoprotein N-acyltransferase [Proteobacteria bacterium]|nr:apolipoprotein N-acyltransferase [Pseudomonadota bacterium]
MPVNKIIFDYIRTLQHKASQHPVFSSFILGLLTFLSFAPFFFLPVLIFVYILFFYLIKNTEKSDTHFLMGSMFFLGVILTGFFWGIRLSALYFESTWPDELVKGYGVAAIAPVLFFAPSILLYGVSAVGIKKLSQKLPSLLFPWGAAVILTGAEMLIGLPYRHGFPWYASGYSLANNIYFIQLAAIGGLPLLSFLVIGVSLSAAAYTGKQHMLTLCLIILCLSFGTYRLSRIPPEKQEPVKLRLVQAAIPVEQNRSEAGKLETFLLYETFSRGEDDAQDRLTIWPEMSVPFFLDESPAQLSHLQALALPEILAGSLRRDIRRNADTGESRDHIYNMAALVNQAGDVQYAAKNILVPYGEYFPFEKYSPSFYERYLPGRVNFTPGGKITVLDSRIAGKIGVLNCYEVLFPAYAANLAAQADMLLNISNDAWISGTWAEQQILYISRIRAVETGRPVVRAANKGMNAVIDGYGRFLFQQNADMPGPQDVSVPQRPVQSTIWLRLNNAAQHILH